MRAVVKPFLVPDPGRFKIEGWELSSPVLGAVEGETVEGWDLNTALSVTARLSADVAGALDDCQLGAGSSLAASLRWRSTRTGLRGVTAATTVSPGPNVLTTTLEPTQLGGTLVVEAIIHLGDAVSPAELAPTESAALLWSDRHSWLLEGEGPRFPVELVDFRRSGMRGSEAAWALHWYHKDLDAPVSSAVRLRLNRKHPAVRRMLNGERDDLQAAAAKSVLRRDLLRELVEVVLGDDDFDTDSEAWPEGSLGRSLAITMAGAFPGLSREDLRAMREYEPDDLESSIQEVTGFLAGVTEL